VCKASAQIAASNISNTPKPTMSVDREPEPSPVLNWGGGAMMVSDALPVISWVTAGTS